MDAAAGFMTNVTGLLRLPVLKVATFVNTV